MNLNPFPETARPAIRHEPASVAFLGSDPSLPTAETLRTWSDFLRAHHPRQELLVVDDGQARPDDAFAGIPRVRRIRHVRPLGVGGMLQTAIAMAQHPLLLAVRSDRLFHPAQAYRLFNSIDMGDLIVGRRLCGTVPLPMRCADAARSWISRLLLGHFRETRTHWLGWGAWGRQAFFRSTFGIPVFDPESGIFLARRAIFDRVPIQSHTTFAFVEAIAKANHLGAWIGEEPLVWIPPASGGARDEPSEAVALFRSPRFRMTSPAASRTVRNGETIGKAA